MKKQVNKMNLWVIDDNYLYSYSTLVGIRVFGAIWMLTTKKYSRTTSKQLTIFSRLAKQNGEETILAEQEDIDKLYLSMSNR